MRFRYSLGLFLTLAAGCTRPSVLVCREVLERGVCRQPVTDLDMGHEYTVFATGIGMPRGEVTLRVVEGVGARERLLANATIRVAKDASYLTNPLTLAHRGHYRVDVVGSDGDVFESVDVRVTHSIFDPPAHAATPMREGR